MGTSINRGSIRSPKPMASVGYFTVGFSRLLRGIANAYIDTLQKIKFIAG